MTQRINYCHWPCQTELQDSAKQTFNLSFCHYYKSWKYRSYWPWCCLIDQKDFATITLIQLTGTMSQDMLYMQQRNTQIRGRYGGDIDGKLTSNRWHPIGQGEESSVWILMLPDESVEIKNKLNRASKVRMVPLFPTAINVSSYFCYDLLWVGRVGWGRLFQGIHSMHTWGFLTLEERMFFADIKQVRGGL